MEDAIIKKLSDMNCTYDVINNSHTMSLVYELLINNVIPDTTNETDDVLLTYLGFYYKEQLLIITHAYAVETAR